ncbi:uncharacterized protein BJ212DRAFT_1302472 [Suillus subaureus]|uniref:acetate--CoA ligase n=1 Tax=Suillus subaureus TaxID=48587 RepID=A0A9P7J9E7_9AGAM|nr:uncharacterized protein BJ212DRAFT_1302472 [Suillus subaureus]KAG1809629.1 hypothetical protein BJ212DRAFT_1302472 [Suillus subaureus]
MTHLPVGYYIVVVQDLLFILYTSGSTGKPKGVVYTIGGYLLCVALTVKYVFDIDPDGKFACMADIGWITGHTYIVYGPLANGVSTTVFESTPVYPTPSRYWQTVQKHQLTQFYSAPTAIRLLRRLGAQHVENHDLSSLRVLGSVGEPINPEAWNWYNEHVGKKQCAIVDTFWQTETGSIVVTPFPGAIETKPHSATVPFFGIESAIPSPVRIRRKQLPVIKQPWPSIARSVYNDHNRYLETYMKPYAGACYKGNGAATTAEIESALIMHKGVAETIVIGTADELTGQAVFAFVTLKPHTREFTYDHNDEASLAKELVPQVRKVISPFAAPRRSSSSVMQVQACVFLDDHLMTHVDADHA